MTWYQWIIYKVGRYFRFVRSLYHKKTNGRWLWGMIGYIKDNPMNIDADTMTQLPESDFIQFIERIFKNDY